MTRITGVPRSTRARSQQIALVAHNHIIRGATVCAASARRKEALSAGLTPLFLHIQYPKKTRQMSYVRILRITQRNPALGTCRSRTLGSVCAPAASETRQKNTNAHAGRYSTSLPVRAVWLCHSAACLRIVRNSCGTLAELYCGTVNRYDARRTKRTNQPRTNRYATNKQMPH